MNDDLPPTLPAHLGWRLLALVYDSLPVIALWFLASVLVLALRGGTPVEPWSLAWFAQCLGLWALTGLYAVESWHRGGQTLGMRPWRLKVLDAAGCTATRARLWQRFFWATLAWLPAGLGFLMSLADGRRRTLHDRLSGTRLLRLPAA
ncbi:RDD family protein [Pseudomarimonas salicorniae]|uniref:RDD family protein n=1 Tax=Pseudomarimonas salicorniae TaxID=2933270 RepID=A0ABT0GGH1_9GAMM|nr:RDD family protein [Lysobacter sp. CAU 1642]MCK7593635.1 RDD family protein [Lysobacter sp. CAU 1642]